MCGRISFKMTWKEIDDILALEEPEEIELPARFQPSYNIAPTMLHPIVHAVKTKRLMAMSKWGFVPSWWSSPQPPKHTINARSETAATTGMFKSAFQSSRCIVPASGYFEWQVQSDSSKQPFYIHRADSKPLLLGGLHAIHDGSDTFAILTTSAPHGLEHVHDRSPVVLEPEQVSTWLDSSTPVLTLQSLCKPAADGILAWHQVSKAVGNVRNNMPELILPA